MSAAVVAVRICRNLAFVLVLSNIAVNLQMSEFVDLTCPSGSSQCATASPDRTLTVRYQSQCLFECQHVRCAGVNYREPGNVCEIYNECQTSFSHFITGCQYLKVNFVSQFQ
jgi:hypothetical protein